MRKMNTPSKLKLNINGSLVQIKSNKENSSKSSKAKRRLPSNSRKTWLSARR